jgi:hypothetical protein
MVVLPPGVQGEHEPPGHLLRVRFALDGGAGPWVASVAVLALAGQPAAFPGYPRLACSFAHAVSRSSSCVTSQTRLRSKGAIKQLRQRFPAVAADRQQRA